MGFLSRLFRRVQEAPLAKPEPLASPAPAREAEPTPEPAAEGAPEESPEPAAEPEPEAEPEPAAEAERELEVEPQPEPEPEAEPAGEGPPVELALTLDEAAAALRAAGSDGIRVGFLSREYLRAGDDERAGARRRLVSVLTEQLRARGLLAEGGRFELREESVAAHDRHRT